MRSTGKGGVSREILQLDATVRNAVREWKRERTSRPGADTPPAAATARPVDQILDELAADAGLVDEDGDRSSPRTPAAHFGTNLLRSGVDAGTILTGHPGWGQAGSLAGPSA